ncbi:MAG: extracellular solute-binding protein [Deltaproteobacteria bacterium]|nr:extracellular solute-binding protein [Deltaproteobacteria bacterium]
MAIPKVMRPGLLLTLSLSLALTLTPTPAQAAPSAEPIRVRLVWSAADARDRAETAALLDRFHASQNAIRVEALPRLWLGYDIQDSYVRFLSLQDPSVDVYLLDTPWIPAFAAPGWLLPLDRYLSPQEQAAFLPAALEGARHDGHLWGLPRSLKGNALFYRRDLLQRAGIAVPKSLAELDRAARTLVAGGHAKVGLALHGMFLRNDIYPMLWASGCELLPGDAPPWQGGPGLTAPRCAEVVAALAAMQQGPHAPIAGDLMRGPASRSYGFSEQQFRDGEAAFAILWTGRLGVLEDEGSRVRGKIGVAPIPGLAAERPGSSNLGIWYFAVSAASRNPEAAVAVVRALTGVDAARARLGMKGELPALTAVAEDPAVLDADPLLAEALATLRLGRNRARVMAERDVGVAFERALFRVLDGGAEPAVALADAATQIAALLADEAAERRALAGLPEAAPEPPPSSGQRPWGRLFAVAALLLALALMLLLLWSERRAHRSLARRLALGAGLVAAALLVAAAGLGTTAQLAAIDQAFAARQAELRAQLRGRAEALGKGLGLSSALLLDIEGVDSTLPLGVTLGHDKPAAASMRQLLLAGRFHDDVVALEVRDRDGSLVLSAEDALFVDERPQRPAEPGVAARIGLRRADVQLRWQGDAPTADLVLPIFREGRLVGGLRVQVSGRAEAARLARERTAQQAAVTSTLRLSLTALLLLVVLAALLARALGRRIGRPLEQLADAARRVGQGELDTGFAERGKDEVARLGAAMNAMVQGLRQRERLRDALDAYLSPEVARELAARPEGLDLPGELRTITVLMADLRGFSTWSRQLGPERTIAALNEALGALTDEVLARDGTVAELLGDAVLAFFGAPVQRPDDPRRAVVTAVAMVGRLPAPLGMGVGLDVGEAIVGSLGGGKRRKYGAVGEVVNRAARIEGLTGRGQVLISAALREALGDDVDVRGPMQTEVKGSGVLDVYDVRAVRDGEGRWWQLPALADAPTEALDEPVRVYRYEGKRRIEAPLPGRLVGEAEGVVWVRTEPALDSFVAVDVVRGAAAAGEAVLAGRVGVVAADGVARVVVGGTKP